MIQQKEDAGTSGMKGEDHKDDKPESMNILRTREIIEEIDSEFEIKEKTARSKVDSSINISIERVEVEALIDTGAQISAVIMETVNKLTEAGIEIKSIPIRRVQIRGAFREKGAVVNYKLQLEVHISDTHMIHEFYVVKSMIYPVVIGVDMLNKYNAAMEYGRKSFTIQFSKEQESLDSFRTIGSMTIEEGNLEVKKLLDQHSKLFEKEIGQVVKPFKGHTYPVPDKYKENVREYLREFETQGIIGRAATQYISPLVVVIKKTTGKIRLSRCTVIK